MEIHRLPKGKQFSYEMDAQNRYAKEYWGKLIIPADFDENDFDEEYADTTFACCIVPMSGLTNNCTPNSFVREYLRTLKAAGGEVPAPTGGVAVDVKLQLDAVLKALTDSAKNKPKGGDKVQKDMVKALEILSDHVNALSGIITDMRDAAKPELAEILGRAPSKLTFEFGDDQ